MLVHTLGTCSGTEPFAGFRHNCTAVETENALYFVDAGENGAYAAHLKGIDLLKTRAVFITHPHMDHVGGLGNLLWYIRKLTIARKQPLEGVNVDILAPTRDLFDATMLLLKNTEGDFVCRHTHAFTETDDSLHYVSANGELTAEAAHTLHMEPKNGKFRSYAYTLTVEGRRLVFMGDMRLEDPGRVLPESGADVLVVETGHYKVEEVAEAVRNCGRPVGTLLFTHHGKSTRADLDRAQQTAERIFDGKVIIARENASYEF